MENPFESLKTEMADIKELLSLVLERLDKIEKSEDQVIGDVHECASWIKKSPSTIYKLVSHREIPHIKSGKKVLFNKEDILSWLSSGARGTITDLQLENDENLQKMQKARILQ
jgi:excisionase family DNA binding protein